ncbi:MAG TPA: GLUG motif-containing protein [Sedimentisphaerales bacterium]|nr:GLUG motif-containing protein [Sedimentisphaerales bacterium]
MKVNGNTTGKRTIITKGAMFIVWLTFAAFTSAAWAGTYSGGSGTEADPYLISTAEDMQSIGANPGDWDRDFLLTADIDLSAYTGKQFNIIGSKSTPFTGVFNGNDHRVSNFTYATTGAEYIGLFGYINASYAVIKDLTLVDPNVKAAYSYEVGCLVGCLRSGTITGCGIEGGRISGNIRTGGLVGRSYYATISNCRAAGSVTGDEGTGGLVGWNWSTISNCHATGSVTGYKNTGGLVGGNYEYGTISSCYAEASVSGGFHYTGGLVGDNRHKISNCYATGNVRGDYATGGLVGSNFSGTTSNCHATGSVTGDDYTGGLVGQNDHSSTITNCYATGSVSGGDVGIATGGLVGKNAGVVSHSYHTTDVVSGHTYVGGLVGLNWGTIENCCAVSTTTGYTSAGGLVGKNEDDDGTISNCYAKGNVWAFELTGGLVGRNCATIENSYSIGRPFSLGGSDVGGLVGGNYEGTISGSFWDIDSSGMDISDGGEGKTTEQMQMQSTFTDAGWDFVGEFVNGTEDIWKICEAVDYPRLEWEIMDWPVIDEEPDMTTGTSNTISWQEVNGAIEYYAICCSDDNLENVVAESGWVDVNEYTFDGLETGRTYWYAVKARQNCVLESEWSDVVGSMQVTLSDIVEIMLDADSLKNSNMKNALLNKIEEVLEMIDAGLYEDALKKLDNDILKKTDGCVTTGQPDKNDWITTCEAQQQIYPFVIETIDYVNSLME